MPPHRLAMPDLILLPRSLLETAALKGLLYPVDGLATSLNEDDWFAYALQLARIQNSTFGLPFAGDSLILLYRPVEVESPPKDWPTALTLSQPMVFPAADEQALFTLAHTWLRCTHSDADGPWGYTTLTGCNYLLSGWLRRPVDAFWLTQFASDDQAWLILRTNPT
jgi:hypothetical protein